MASQNEVIKFLLEVVGNENVVAMAKAIKDAGTAGSDAEPHVKALTDELNGLLDKSRGVDTLISLKSQLGETGLQLQNARAGAAALSDEFDRTDTSNRKVTAAFAAADQAVASLTTRHNALTAQVATQSGALERSGVDVNNLAAAHALLSTRSAEVAKNLESVVISGGRTSGIFQNLVTHVENFGRGVLNAGQQVLALGGHLLTITGVAAGLEAVLTAITGFKLFEVGIEDATAFQTSMTKVGIAVNATAEQLAEMGKAAEEAGAKTGTGGADAAAALAILAKGAGSAEAAVAQLVPTLTLAKAAQISVADAANIVGTAIAEFGLEAADSTRVTDILAKTASLAKTDLNDLSTGFAKVAPDAKAAGVTIEQTAALFAALADNGIRGKKATSDLSQTFIEFANPASKLNQVLLGLHLDGLSLVDVLAKLSTNGEGTTRVVEALGGKAGSAFRALAASVPDLQRLNGELANSQGAAQGAADKFGNELPGAFTRFKKTVDDLASALVAPILEPLASGFNKLAKVVDDFSKTENFAKIKKAVLDFVNGAIEGITRFVESLGTSLDTSTTSIADFIKKSGEYFNTFTESVGVMGRVVSGVGQTIALVFNTISGVLGIFVQDIARGIQYGETAFLALQKLRGATQQEIASMQGQINAAKQTADDLEARTKASFDAAGKNIEGITKAINGNAAAVDGVKPKVAAHTDGLNKAGEAAKGAAVAHDGLTAAVTNATPAVEKLTAAQKAAEAQQKALKTAAADLGITLQKTLKDNASDAEAAYKVFKAANDGTAESIANEQNAFLAYAQKRLAASAQLDISTRERVKAELDSQAAVEGVTSALADLEKQSDNSQAALVSDANRGTAALDKEFDAAAKVSDKLAGEHGGSVAEAAQEAGDNVKDMAGGGGDSLAQLDNALASTRSGFLAVSDAAAKAFDRRLLQDFNNEFDATGIGFAKVIGAMGDAAKATTDEIAAQRTQLQGEIDNINTLGVASTTSFGSYGNNVVDVGRRVAELSALIQQGTYDAGLLGQQELAPLQAALDAAKQRMDALKAAADQATQSLEQLNQQLQDDRDAQNNDLTSIENRRYQQQVAQIQALAQAAGDAGKAQAAQDLQLAEQIHLKKLSDISAQAKAQQDANKSTSTSSSGSGAGITTATPSATQGGSQFTSQVGGGAAPSGITHQITLNIDGSKASVYTDASGYDVLLRALQTGRNNSITGG
jgi:TP901 family phage tail tape measure protein